MVGLAPKSQPVTAPHEHRDPTTRWRVLYTRSRQEKALAASFDAARIEYFLPLVKRIAYHGGRRRIVHTPLFPSYIFLFGSHETVGRAQDTRRVVHEVSVPDVDQLAHELKHLRTAIKCGAPLDPYPCLTAGRPARVVRGPFQGVEGVIEHRIRIDRLVLQIETLGQAASLEIDASLLEPLE